ncbi:carbonic anhydrase 2-like [Tropilaelaps mercedesae]|uniref:Carbonic anhydrase n=1 Tax=Tropilaelaps mercedesae TaxID=418985 RepID=A0A1V9WZJ3_9ACAR|nr:carbonic anhydrase 2-like [Tropilaelaps mercedesae]
MGIVCGKLMTDPLNRSIHPISTVDGYCGLYGQSEDAVVVSVPRHDAWVHSSNDINKNKSLELNPYSQDKSYVHFGDRENRALFVPKSKDGPAHWGRTYPQALGQKQSPVDIVRAQVQLDTVLLKRPLKYNYQGVSTKSIANGGFGWRVDVESENHNLEGGPLNHRFRLVQFHSHWGETGCNGSEHTVDGEAFSGELHLVHCNIDLYNDPGKAACSENGLAVVGIFLKEGGSHPEFEKLCKLLTCIKYKGCKYEGISDFDICAFLPKDVENYWTYEGSLTTPPCYESVSWIVLKQPIEVSKDQFDAFRSLVTYSEDENDITIMDGPVTKNWRNCQPLENRVIREPPTQ